MHMYKYTYIHKQLYTYIYTYTHTHTYIYIYINFNMKLIISRKKVGLTLHLLQFAKLCTVIKLPFIEGFHMCVQLYICGRTIIIIN